MVTKRLQYRYDAVGNKVGMTDADGGLFTYTYDVMRRLTGVINPLGERTTYTYDLNGRRTSAQLANGTRTSYSYDQGSRVQQIHTLKSNNSTVAKFNYAYDDNGRRTNVLEADGSRVTWTYDGTSQVTSEWRTGTSPFRHTFVYDTRGNRTLKIEDGARTTLVFDAANQLSSSQDAGGTTTYTYDANGNQHVTVAPGGSRTTQIWDYENRLVKTLQPGGGVFTLAYDADGLRVRKETPSETKLFVWDDQNYLAETDDSGVTEVAYTTEPSTYGSTISHRSGGATTTYHFDALAAARVLTNTSETVLESYNYTAFGTILGTPTLLTPFLWGGLVGYYWDAELATQYIRARYYQPNIARWISLDPIEFAGGDANLFRYVGNSPVSGTNTFTVAISFGTNSSLRLHANQNALVSFLRNRTCRSRKGCRYTHSVFTTNTLILGHGVSDPSGYKPIERSRCEKALKIAMESALIVAQLDQMKASQCRPPQISCGECDGKVLGGYVSPNIITICTEMQAGNVIEPISVIAKRIEDTLAHELVHASDDCQFPLPPNDKVTCRQLLCIEARAYSCSNDCPDDGGRLSCINMELTDVIAKDKKSKQSVCNGSNDELFSILQDVTSPDSGCVCKDPCVGTAPKPPKPPKGWDPPPAP